MSILSCNFVFFLPSGLNLNKEVQGPVTLGEGRGGVRWQLCRATAGGGFPKGEHGLWPPRPGRGTGLGPRSLCSSTAAPVAAGGVLSFILCFWVSHCSPRGQAGARRWLSGCWSRPSASSAGAPGPCNRPHLELPCPLSSGPGFASPPRGALLCPCPQHAGLLGAQSPRAPHRRPFFPAL